MGTFKDSLKKWFFTQGTQPTIEANTRVALLDAQGNPIGSETPTNIFANVPFITGNVGIASTTTTKMSLARVADSIGSNAVGVWIYEGGHLIVVPKERSSAIPWSATAAAGGTEYLDTHAAIADFDGATKTQTIYNTLGDDATAAKYALEYAPAGLEDDTMYGVGKWYLPSVGEMMMIAAHLQEVQYVMQLIGATFNIMPTTGGSNYHTSTEYSRSAEISVYLGNPGSYLRTNRSKTTSNFFVLPVCAMY